MYFESATATMRTDEMSEQVENEDETAVLAAGEPVGSARFTYYAGPMVRDVTRVSVIVGGFGAVLLTVHHGINFFADPSSDFGDVVDRIFGVFD